MQNEIKLTRVNLSEAKVIIYTITIYWVNLVNYMAPVILGLSVLYYLNST